MKQARLWKYIAFALPLSILAAACSDSFLERPPIDTLTDGIYYQTDDEVIMATAPLYNIVWFDFNDKTSFGIGDARAGNMLSNDYDDYYKFAVSATDGPLLSAYASFYKIIAQSNMVIENVNRYATNVTPAVKNHAIAEARFMRGLAYTYLTSIWKEVPIIYDNLAILNDTTIRRNTVASIWEFAIRDFRYAAKNLPTTPILAGRLTKYSAEGMLARAFLTRAGIGAGVGSRNQTDLDSAKYYAKDVIMNSGLSLLDNYGDLFLSANNNAQSINNETLFALLWLPIREPWGVNNSFQAYMAFSPELIGNQGDGWGRAHGASADLVKYYMSNPDDLRRKPTFMFNGDRYPELKYFADPSITYTINDVANIKKYIIGGPEDNGGAGQSMTAYINTYMMRLAEVYLIYAEAILGNNSVTTDGEALKYVNAIRQRAGLPNLTSVSFMDIFNEKRIELAMEGRYWHELVRLSYFNMNGVDGTLDIISKQDKGPYTIDYVPGTENPRQYDVTYPTVDGDGAAITRFFPATEENFYFPYPDAELVKAPSLRKSAVDFDFSVLSN
jgi:hypothetical protein